MLRHLLALTMAASSLTTVAYGVELHQATNQQILDELAYRLRTGGGGGGGGISARAMYACTNTASLEISVINQNGSEATESIYVGNQTNCARQAQTLNTYRSRVFNLTVAAICDSTANLKRFTISPDGNISELQSRYIGNMPTCLTQADELNTGN